MHIDIEMSSYRVLGSLLTVVHTVRLVNNTAPTMVVL